MAQRPSAVPVLSRVGRPVLCAGCGAEQEVVPKEYPSLTRLGRGPGAEEWSEELAMEFDVLLMGTKIHRK